MQESGNPQAVLEAVMDAPERFGDVVIHDITIFRYAYLEKLKSPFIYSDKEFSVEEVIPTVYALAADKAELKKYGNDVERLKLDALDWADENLKVEDVPDMIRSVVAKLQTINKAAPRGAAAQPDGKKN